MGASGTPLGPGADGPLPAPTVGPCCLFLSAAGTGDPAESPTFNSNPCLCHQLVTMEMSLGQGRGWRGPGREGAGCSCRDDLPLLSAGILIVGVTLAGGTSGAHLGKGLGGACSFLLLASTRDHPRRGHRAPATKAVGLGAKGGPSSEAGLVCV